MAPGLGRFDSEPPATSERTTLLKDVREPGALKPDIIRPPSGTEKYRLCAMEWNCVKASDGRLLLAPKVIAVVIGIIGIALLAFPDPMRKLVDSFGRIKPLGSAAHLAIESQKGLASEPLPLGISIADGSGGETDDAVDRGLQYEIGVVYDKRAADRHLRASSIRFEFPRVFHAQPASGKSNLLIKRSWDEIQHTNRH
jgi:hypothetical protein